MDGVSESGYFKKNILEKKEMILLIEHFENKNDYFNKIISSSARSHLLIWLIKNLNNVFSQKQLEHIISSFDQVQNEDIFGITHQKILLLTCVRIYSKIHFVEEQALVSKFLENELYSSGEINGINQCEIYVCNQISWQFKSYTVMDFVYFFLEKLNFLEDINISPFFKILEFFYENSLCAFCTQKVPKHSLAIVLILMSFDQIDFTYHQEIITGFLKNIEQSYFIDLIRIDNYKKLLKEFIEFNISIDRKTELVLVHPDQYIDIVLKEEKQATNNNFSKNSMDLQGKFDFRRANSLKFIKKKYLEMEYDTDANSTETSPKYLIYKKSSFHSEN